MRRRHNHRHVALRWPSGRVYSYNDQIAREVDLAVGHGINPPGPAAPVIAKLSPVILPPLSAPNPAPDCHYDQP